jgi:hypothetical protein
MSADDNGAARALAGLVENPGAVDRRSFTKAVAGSARSAGARAVADGRWLSETVVDLAGHIPIRDLRALSAHHGGLTGDRLAAAVIESAGRASASIGAAAGAVMAAEELLPTAWFTIPLEVLAETAAVAGIEMKLIAELHEVYGRPVPAKGRALALAQAWAQQRGITPAVLTGGVPAMAESLGRGTRKQVIRMVRRRLLRRAGGTAVTAAPFLIGAAAGAFVNRRSTLRLGRSVVVDLPGV